MTANRAKTYSREGSIAERHQRAARQNRELVNWAGNLAYEEGPRFYQYEVVTARRPIRTKFGLKLSGQAPMHVPVWISLAVVLEELEGDKFKVALPKIDEIESTRRARIGIFVVGQNDISTTNMLRPVRFDSNQQQGEWLTTYAIGGCADSHGNAGLQEPELDEINIAMHNRWLGRSVYLSGVERNLSELMASMRVINDSITGNDHNLGLRQHLAGLSM